MNISIIVAMTKDYIIGNGNDLPWNVPEELQYFRKITLNKVVIMGSNTFIAIKKKPLPNRFNIVITSNPKKFYDISYYDNIEFATSISESLKLANIFYSSNLESHDTVNNYSKNNNKNIINMRLSNSSRNSEVMIIGGSNIYKQFLTLANRLYISIVKEGYPGNVFFPEYDTLEWHKVFEQEHQEFIAQIYERNFTPNRNN